MNVIEAVIFGVVQGVTEFLPISSSGHLVVLHQWFATGGALDLTFDVALHLGTLLAVVVYFWRDIVALVGAAARFHEAESVPRHLLMAIAIGTIPAVVIGYWFEEIIGAVFRSVSSVAVMLIAVALLMFIVERFSRRQRPLDSIRWRDGLLIGVAQAVALIPGTSRSGITIIAGMSLGLERAAAARFSFLLALPVIIGAGIKKAFTLGTVAWTAEGVVGWVVGIAAAAIVGWLAIGWLLRFLQNRPLHVFAWYRIVLGLILLIFFT